MRGVDAYLFGRIGGEVGSFTLPEDRDALDRWAARCRPRAPDPREFDTVHRFVTQHLDTAPLTNSLGAFPSITWTDGDVPLSVSYLPIPHDSGTDRWGPAAEHRCGDPGPVPRCE